MLLKFAERGKKPTRAAAMGILTLAFVLATIYYGYVTTGRWHFLKNTYGFVLSVGDLQPNVGVFWYFYAEVFEYFRKFFVCCLQINATVLYLMPLALTFRNDVVLLTTALMYLTAIFKTYPDVGDFGLTLALLPMWSHLFGRKLRSRTETSVRLNCPFFRKAFLQ